MLKLNEIELPSDLSGIDIIYKDDIDQQQQINEINDNHIDLCTQMTQEALNSQNMDYYEDNDADNLDEDVDGHENESIDGLVNIFEDEIVTDIASDNGNTRYLDDLSREFDV